ncbi:bifunctional proline dehydrogenase/L-glutamate gamma-semialdehyde dehydrogenase [Mergibacter septicus]|uniref:bifunctional proline dehydrogenase/L-glutamate gamma-semialdehyde dehydrogenase PutA n=1 Tax=Mergibacter septicus TaxID=221402 RepID=UPI0011790058|nr:bifunctional proline dehydrogenase/L-glutamate gamma-semialdehyde dehydrogenase PutA [Mergibacter septicus]AWX14376.1 bifunctional proline dehydrogenase/L-glutamate gamma-semialdehyde dehydrogenase [Mergibacter septicus]
MSYKFTHKNGQNLTRQLISQYYCLPEKQAIQPLFQQLQFTLEQEQRITQTATDLIHKVRSKRQKQSGVDALMNEFSLDCDEGIALMCLSEALLRIPDVETRYALIYDKLKDGDWKAHIGKSASLFVNAASYGLLIGSKVSRHFSEEELSSALSRSFSKLSAPIMQKAMEKAIGILGKQFVAGESIEAALASIKEREKRGYRFSFDMLGEAALTSQDVERYFNAYIQAIHAVGRLSTRNDPHNSNGVSVKLSALHPRYSRLQQQRVIDELYPKLKALFSLAKQYNIGVSIDAEEMARLELSINLFEKLIQEPDLANFEGLGFVVQAYSKRCSYVIKYLIELARKHQRKLMIRLVKGAYWDSEIKWAQAEGVDNFPVYTRKVHSDISYLYSVKQLLAAQDVIYPQFATHNAQTLATIKELGKGKNFEFQCLYGMGETLYDTIVSPQQRVRVYAPVGTHKTLLAYLVRRLLENGANSSFVHQLVDENRSVESLTLAPWKKYQATAGERNTCIQLPPELFLHRKNSRGFNLNNEVDLEVLNVALNQSTYTNASSITSVNCISQPARAVFNPANLSEKLAEVSFLGLDQTETVFNTSNNQQWQKLSAIERANILNRAADLYQENTGVLLKITIEEAGKTLSNAINELREAVDFLRYYAEQIVFLEQQKMLAEPLGKALCISPWNFPLAIFTGQVAAALAAGNSVVAKPAEQTSLIAYSAVKLLHQAGVPVEALQLVLGDGELGQLLVEQAFNAVIFTGSTQVAKAISQQLAKREDNPILIAETGGLNAMVVDSSALLEQVTVDILNSAFDSSGQRCSALRLLLVQDDIASDLYKMLNLAMQELKLGDPRELATDIGPVIDQEAKSHLQAYQQKLRTKAVSYTELEPKTTGHFVAPSLYEIANLDELRYEIFGPVLHFLRYKKQDLETILAQLNQRGYALTGGCHSRISQTVRLVEEKLNCGNYYINRNIVGAVVGVQPFGGYGLSGTGPKAGGELYVQRLTKAKTLYSSRSSEPVRLPSITGEVNTIAYRPCQIALLNGDQEQAKKAYNLLQKEGFSIVVEPEHSLAKLGLVGVKVSSQLENCQKGVYLQPLSQEKRVELITRCPIVFTLYDWTEQQDLTLLFNEFSRSENTTAAGGNTSLMVADEG